MESRPTVAFSSDGALFAVVSGGGQDVCVWESSTSKQLCRVSNKSKWSTVLSLVWAPSKLSGPRKKRKRASTAAEGGPPLLAVGNSQGLVLWDVGRNEEQCTMPSDGVGGVVSISWGGEEILYVADGSPEVIRWTIGKDLLSKWKADKRGVSCVCSRNHGDVLTAGKSIKLWDPINQTLIKRFTGHINNVHSLLFVSPTHFLSAAENDRTISLWNIESGNGTSLICEKEVWSICTHNEETQDEKMNVVTVCEDGTLHLFVIDCHNHMKTSVPFLPHTTIEFVTKPEAQSPTSLPVFGSYLTTTGDVLVSHSSFLRPTFETIPFNQSEERLCLIRTQPKGLFLTKDNSKTTYNKDHSSVTVLGLSSPRMLPWQQGKEKGTEEVPMTDRLQSLSLGDESSTVKDKSHSKYPTTESLTLLVVQAVHSGDKRLLEQALIVNNERLVVSTVRKLPVTAVIPFLKILVDLLHEKPNRGNELIIWIRILLLYHTAYLLTVPHLLDTLSLLYQSMDMRVSLFGKLAKLHGKLDLLLAQTSEDDNIIGQSESLTTPFHSLTAGADQEPSDDDEETVIYESDEEDDDFEDHEDEEEDQEDTMDTHS